MDEDIVVSLSDEGANARPGHPSFCPPLNPLQSVRGRKHDTTDGKTPALSIQQARDLLRSIDISYVVALRDRALLGTIAYTGNRAS